MGILEEVHDAEIEIFRSLNLAGTNYVLDALMLFFTFLGISYVIVLVSVPLWIRGRREAAFDVVVLVIVVTVAVEALKIVIDRPRPAFEIEGVKTIMSATGPSFPSAHAARAFAVALLIALVESRRLWMSGVFVAILVSVSRVYLGVHWPTDVFAGAMLGLAIAAGLWRYARVSPRYQTLRRKTIGIFEGSHA